MSGLKIKRKHARRNERTASKQQRREEHLARLLDPGRRQISKMSKGQIRRNIRRAFPGFTPTVENCEQMGAMLGKPRSRPKQ